MRKISKKGFTMVELIVGVAVVAILILLAAPRFLGYTQKAQLVRIQHDTKVMEQEMQASMVEGTDISPWINNTNDFNILIEKGVLFEKEGVAKSIYSKHLSNNGVLDLHRYFTLIGDTNGLGVGGESYSLDELPEDFAIYKTYKVIPEKYKNKINTKLKGTFYVNIDGKVYYEHGRPIPQEEEGPNCPIPSELGYDFQLINGKGTIVSWTGTTQYLTIPPYFLLDGECVPVQVIGRGAFMRGNFKRITLPMTLEKIHEGAFGSEISAEELYIPHTNMDIEDNFFSEGSIGEINISGETNSYNPIKFKGANVNYTSPTPNDLGIIIHPESGTIISSSSNTKVGKTNAKSEVNNYEEHNYSGGALVIPEKIKIPGREEPIVVKKVAKGAFQGEGLIEVNLPFTLERIEAYAFAGNQLSWVKIPSSVNFIGEYAFAFNEQTHSLTGEKRATIGSINIKDKEYINRLDDYGNIKDPIAGVELQAFVFVTSIGNHVIEYESDVFDSSNSEQISFDGITDGESKSINISGTYELTWQGDPTNREIEIETQPGSRWEQSGRYWSYATISLSFADDDGKRVPLITGVNSITLNNYGSTARRKTKVVIPEGATKMRLYSGGGVSSTLYSVKMSDKSGNLPRGVRNVTSTSDTTNIYLTWSYSDGNTNKVALFRDGEFIKYVEGRTYVDTVREPDTEYKYTLRAVGPTGSVSKTIAEHSSKTKKVQIDLIGIDPASIDGDLETGHDIGGSLVVTWNEDLTGREIVLYATGGTGTRFFGGNYFDTSSKLTFRFLDDNNNVIPMGDGRTEIDISKSNRDLLSTTVTVPKNATKMRFVKVGDTVASSLIEVIIK